MLSSALWLTSPPLFYAPDRRIPRRQPTPGELLFSFQATDNRYYTCELRFHGESYGWETQFFEGAEFRYGRRFLFREEAIRWAETERRELEDGRGDDAFWSAES